MKVIWVHYAWVCIMAFIALGVVGVNGSDVCGRCDECTVDDCYCLFCSSRKNFANISKIYTYGIWLRSSDMGKLLVIALPMVREHVSMLVCD